MEESARAGTLDKVLLETDSHDQFLRSLMSSLVSTTKASNSVPKGLDYNYHNSFADFRKVRDGSSSKATELMVQLLEYTRPTSSDSGPMQLSEEESDPYLYGQIIDTIDLLLDRAERTLARSDADNFGREVSSHLRETMLLDKDRIIRENIKSIPKPQLKFLFDIDNSRQTIFAPKLKRKFHSRMEYKAAIQYIEDEPESAFYPHPYEFELQRLEYPAYLLKKPKTTEMVLPDALRPYVFVGTEEELMRAIEELKSCKEIAVDCEHHSVRSFQGLTCLMQLSSRTKDYIIDTLALRLVLSQLGEIFANPKIVKVFHGCESDIYWLQRDFGLYVVNCFDTYVGAKQLRFSALSLAHLVRYYCGVTLDKTHQLSDWRQRPLTEDMLVYARRDTQYLLSIFDAMRRDLWNAASPTVSAAYNSKEDSATGSVDFIEAVLAGSKRLCLNRYAKPVFDPLGYQALVALDKQVIKATNGHAQLTPAQESVLAALWDWRDATARAEDESVTFIMANSEMIRLSLSIPRSIDSVHEKMASQALVLLTPYVLEHLDDVIQVVNAAASKNSGDGQQRETWKALSGSTVLSASSEAKKPSTNASSASASAVSSTIFAFNPSAANATASSSLNILTNNINNGSHSNTLGSPVLPLDEMFRRAGWKTPLNAPATTKAGLAINDEDAEEEELDENTERLVSSASTAAATASNAARTSGTSAPVTGTPVQSLGPLASWSPLIFEAIKPTSVHPSVLFATAPTSSNSSTNPMSTSNSNLNNLRASGGSQISEANRRLVSKSLESLYKSVESKVGLEKCLRDIAFSDPHAASTTDVAASAEDGMADMSEDIVDNDGNVLPEIPRSFEEIYRLSGKLRHKKQQKTQQQLQQGDLPASKVPANKRSFASANSALEAFGSVLDGDDSDDSDNEEGDLQSYLAKRNLAPSAASLSNTGSVAATVPAVGKAGKASNNAAKSTAGAGSDVTNLAATAGENREIVDQTVSMLLDSVCTHSFDTDSSLLFCSCRSHGRLVGYPTMKLPRRCVKNTSVSSLLNKAVLTSTTTAVVPAVSLDMEKLPVTTAVAIT